jgi:hypothetical protein
MMTMMDDDDDGDDVVEQLGRPRRRSDQPGWQLSSAAATEKERGRRASRFPKIRFIRL